LHQWIYVSTFSYPTTSSQIRVYPLTGNGAVSPDHIIAGSHTGLADPSAMALDRSRNLYVANGLNGSQSISEFGPDASGDISPIRTIGGSNTGLDDPRGLAVDSCGDIYVLNTQGSNVGPLPGSILEFAPYQSGNVAPVQVLFGSDARMSQPSGMAQWGAYLAVSQAYNSTITFFDIVDPTAPVFALGGAPTSISQPHGVAVDDKGALYVISFFNSGEDDRVLVFPFDLQTQAPILQNATPSRIVTFPDDSGAHTIAVGTEGNLYALSTYFSAPPGTPFLYVYGPTANGNDPPSATLSDPGLTVAEDLLVEDAVTTGDVPAHPAQVGRSISRAASVLGPYARC
jgi:hypothetical protein